MDKLLEAITHFVFTIIVLGYIVYEELVWERFAQPMVRYIQSLRILQKLEAYLQRVNGVVILIAFVVLFLITELQGVYAGVLLLKGNILLWFFVYGGKVPVAAFTFWLFRVTKPKLMAFGWFERSYKVVMLGVEWLKSTEIYINIKSKAAEIKRYFKKHYLREGDSTMLRFKRIYRRLKIRFKGFLSNR